MKKADLLALSRFHPGDEVRLTDNVLHKEYAGRRGFVRRVIKSRCEVEVIVFGMMNPYRAAPANVEIIKEGNSHEA